MIAQPFGLNLPFAPAGVCPDCWYRCRLSLGWFAEDGGRRCGVCWAWHRPSEEDALDAAFAFVLAEGHDVQGDVGFEVFCPDGGIAWAFAILKDDTTSYVHENLRIEWLGTSRHQDSA